MTPITMHGQSTKGESKQQSQLQWARLLNPQAAAAIPACIQQQKHLADLYSKEASDLQRFAKPCVKLQKHVAAEAAGKHKEYECTKA